MMDPNDPWILDSIGTPAGTPDPCWDVLTVKSTSSYIDFFVRVLRTAVRIVLLLTVAFYRAVEASTVTTVPRVRSYVVGSFSTVKDQGPSTL